MRLREIPGIGDWTVSCILMRLGDTDAFPATDLGVRRALELLDRPHDAAGAPRLAEPWRPWRAYAVQHLWSIASPRAGPGAPRMSRHAATGTTPD